MPETTAAPVTLQSIPVDKIKPAAHQARKTFDDESIKALAESIRQEGLLQPILVRPVAEGYELISGERRLRATKLLAVPTIEAKVIQPLSEAETAAKGLVENLQREDLNPMEEAEGFDELYKLDPNYWTHDQIAKTVGRSRVYITQSIGLLGLPDDVKADVCRQTLTRSHALDLARLSTAEDQMKAAKEIEAKDLNRKEARKLVDQMLAKANGKDDGVEEKPKASDPLDKLWKQLEADRYKLGAWSVAYPKEDEWAFHFKPDREKPVNALADLLDGLSIKLRDYLIKNDNLK